MTSYSNIFAYFISFSSTYYLPQCQFNHHFITSILKSLSINNFSSLIIQFGAGGGDGG